MAENLVAENIITFEGMTPKIGQKSWVHSSSTIIGDVALGEDVSI